MSGDEVTKQWYVIQVMAFQEKKVKQSIEEGLEEAGMKDFIDDVIIPTKNVCEVKNGEKKVVEKKLWPGYILVRMAKSDEAWVYVRHINGVFKFMEDPLRDEEVEALLKNLDNNNDSVVQKYELNLGDRVKIIDGVFSSFSGEVVNIFHEKGEMSVMVEIFGRKTRVDNLEFWQAEVLD